MPESSVAEAATERLRDYALVILGIVYLAPLVLQIPPAINVAITATVTIFAAGLRTLGKTSEAETISKKEALKFPVWGSLSLFGLFLAIKFLPREWLNYIITFYFCLIGTFAIGELLVSTLHKVIPKPLHETNVLNLQQFKIPYLMPEPEDVKISVARAITNLFGLAFTVWYALTRHFLANNGMGLAYSIEGIAMLNLGSTQVGMIMLWGLFFYDIFWVFFTPVMVTVAKSINGPIKLLFPTSAAWDKFNMLGLGDIVIPGLFVSLMLRFDTVNGSGKKYFFTSVVGYLCGIVATLVVMYAFSAAQPALLYIVPCLAGSVFLQAYRSGEVMKLWAFTDEEASNDKAAPKSDEKGESPSEADAGDKKAQ